MLGEPDKQERKKIKVVFLGDRGVGKSSIITRFITKQFDENIQPTIGVDFMSKNIQFKDQNYRIQLWDTAGQQKYRSLVKGYLKSADACIFVYDCTNLDSLISIPEWLKLFDEVCQGNAYKIIVGNKCDKQYDLQNWREAKREVEKFNSLGNMVEFISSARIGLNIENIFQHLIEEHFKKDNDPTQRIKTKLKKLQNITMKQCCGS